MKILAKFFIPLASTLVIGSPLDINSGLAATLNFQEATQGLLKFRDDTGTQIGSGSFEYSQAPIEGTFIWGSGGEYYFTTDPSQIPEELFPPRKTVSISADQDLRLVTNTSINILGTTFENRLADLSSFSGKALLFQPTQNTFFPPGRGGPFEVSLGDPRSPDLLFENRWFLGDVGPSARQQLSMYDDGGFGGFDVDIPIPPRDFYGKWEAEAVPEPLSVLGAASALGFGIYFKSKNGKKQRVKVKEKANT